jgi:hypothetical protein
MTTIFKLRLLGCYIGLVLLVVATTHGAGKFRVRTWTDKTGQFEIVAEYQQIKGNNVVLVEPGGKIHDIRLTDLSAHDTEYVRLTNRGMEPAANFDAITEAKPFIIDINKGESKYLHRVKYPGKIDASNLLVEITISGNGDRAFPSSTLQMQPVALGKTVKYVIRLAPKPDDETMFDLAADVEARMTYDAAKKEFVVYVKPSVAVIRGRAGADQLPLSIKQCLDRVALIQQTIQRFKQNIKNAPAQIRAIAANHARTKALLQAAVGAMQFGAANLLGVQVNQIEIQWKAATRQLKGKINRIPAMQIDLSYLDEIANTLQGMKTITVQYRIFSKIGESKKLILDGT